MHIGYFERAIMLTRRVPIAASREASPDGTMPRTPKNFMLTVFDDGLGQAPQDGRRMAAHGSPEDASISAVAYRVGFKSLAHLSRMFKREFKMSPRQYRLTGVPAE